MQYCPFKFRSLSIAALIVACALCAPSAWASSAGATVLPYEAWLTIFQKSLTGPVAFSVALVGIIASGTSLILMGGEISSFFRTVIYLIFVMALLVGANSLMTNFFNGSAIALPNATQSSLVDNPNNHQPQRRSVFAEDNDLGSLPLSSDRELYDYQQGYFESALALH